mmetsp:Transcript_40654/g.91301  ORF Transcript_40654/g.91301 Transcript_40654/m.91301 type:complete len:396 (-) Transcript_40654:29-1216(-)|eukprot:6393720-Amphidinium_carterae.1
MEQQLGEFSYGSDYTFESDPFAAPRFYPSDGMQQASWQPQQFAQCYGPSQEMPMQSQAVPHMQFGTMYGTAHSNFSATHDPAGMESMHGEFAGMEQHMQQHADQQPMMFFPPGASDTSQWHNQAAQQTFNQGWHMVPAMAWAPVAQVPSWAFTVPDWVAQSTSSSSTGPAQMPQQAQMAEFSAGGWSTTPTMANPMQLIMAPTLPFPGYVVGAASPAMPPSALPQASSARAAPNVDRPRRLPLEIPMPDSPVLRRNPGRPWAPVEETSPAQARSSSSLQRALRFSALGKCEEGACKEPCPICLEDMTKGQLLRTLPCFHMFHQGCAEQYFQCESLRLGEDDNISCPLCRFAVGPEVIDVDFDESPHSPDGTGFSGVFLDLDEAQLSSAEDDDDEA